LKPELVWVDQQPPPAEGKVLICEYVQTFWPEHFQQRLPKAEAFSRRIHLTTGTFNLLSKTNSHSRLSGAPSVRLASPKRKPGVLETC
jgi:hypothetical protein